jgi:hypothetical protein
MGQAVPSGYVITKIAHTATCGAAAGPNTMTLLNYTGLKTFTACGPITIPGYLVTAAATTAACQGINVVVKDRTVTMPTYNTVTLAAYQGLNLIKACAPLNIPSGYVATAYSTTVGCKPLSGAITPWNTLTLTKYEGLATFTACMPLNPIPSGYVVTARTRVAACGAAPGVNAVTLKRL